MKKLTLAANPRDVIGRKVKSLRSRGILPGTIYGKNIPSVSVGFSHDEFVKVYKEAGETGLVELTIDGAVRPVLIHAVQADPVDNRVLHVEFHQVDLKEKVSAMVPLEFTGESLVVLEKQGVVLRVLDEVEVEALPADLPDKISVDLSSLTAVDQEIAVAGLPKSSRVAVLTDPALTVVKIAPLVSKEVETQVAEEAAAAAEAEAKEEAPTKEGEAPKETPQPTPPPTEEKKESAP